MEQAETLYDLLELYTIKLIVPGEGHGTGCFVSPGVILTCAHVVERAKDQFIKVCWQQRENFAEAKIEQILPFFDIALLKFIPPINSNLPCVCLKEEVMPDDELYLFGYPDKDYPNGCPATFICEGKTGDNPLLIKFKLGQVRPGMSGSPLLNKRTNGVCGIVKSTRDRSFDLGGEAIPTSVIFSQFSKLREEQRPEIGALI